jgi:hypothetical protein
MKAHAHDSERKLLFDWHGDDRTWLRMVVALPLTLVGLFALFVVFRVVAPTPSGQAVRPQHVLVLNPEVPAERALIHRAMDRSFPILPAEPAESLVAIRRPRLAPGYAGQELRLKPLPADLGDGLPVRPVAAGLLLLPPPAAIERPGPVSHSARQRLVPIFDEALTARAPAAVDWGDLPLAETARLQFHLAVDARGRVTHVLPLVLTEEAELGARLAENLRSLRFREAPSGTVTTGLVRLQWREVPAP